MNSITNCYIWIKYYLNLFEIVTDKMRSFTSLAGDLANLKHYFVKNITKIDYSFFIVMMIWLSSEFTSHTNYHL